MKSKLFKKNKGQGRLEMRVEKVEYENVEKRLQSQTKNCEASD